MFPQTTTPASATRAARSRRSTPPRPTKAPAQSGRFLGQRSPPADPVRTTAHDPVSAKASITAAVPRGRPLHRHPCAPQPDGSRRSWPRTQASGRNPRADHRPPIEWNRHTRRPGRRLQAERREKPAEHFSLVNSPIVADGIGIQPPPARTPPSQPDPPRHTGPGQEKGRHVGPLFGSQRPRRPPLPRISDTAFKVAVGNPLDDPVHTPRDRRRRGSRSTPRQSSGPPERLLRTRRRCGRRNRISHRREPRDHDRPGEDPLGPLGRGRGVSRHNSPPMRASTRLNPLSSPKTSHVVFPEITDGRLMTCATSSITWSGITRARQRWMRAGREPAAVVARGARLSSVDEARSVAGRKLDPGIRWTEKARQAGPRRPRRGATRPESCVTTAAARTKPADSPRRRRPVRTRTRPSMPAIRRAIGASPSPENDHSLPFS